MDWNLSGAEDAGRPVLAGASGTATIHPGSSGYGNYVDVSVGGGWLIRFAHLSAFSVSNGATVGPLTQVGTVGMTGTATGNHLHYEQRLNGVVQPATFHAGPIAYAYSLPGHPYVSMNCTPPTNVVLELVHYWQSGSGGTDAVQVTPGGLTGGGPTAFGAVAPGFGQFGLGYFNNDTYLDLYLVITQGDPSAHSAVFVAAGPAYTSFLSMTTTPMGQFGPDHGDIVIADFTGDGKSDVGAFFANNGAPNAAFGVLNAATNFQTWSYLSSVPIGGHDGYRSDAVAGDFDANGSMDLGVGFHAGTPTGQVDFFVLSGSSSYQASSSATLPIGGWLDGQGQLLSGRFGTSRDQVAAVYTAGTPTGRPDLFVLNGLTSVANAWTLPVGTAPSGQRTFIGR